MAITVSSALSDPQGPRQFQDLFTVIPFSATLVVASIADAATDEGDITVPGAALGDFVLVAIEVDNVNVNLRGDVTAANTVTITINNESAAAFTGLASPGATVNGLVLKPKGPFRRIT